MLARQSGVADLSSSLSEGESNHPQSDFEEYAADYKTAVVVSRSMNGECDIVNHLPPMKMRPQ
jgi:hypothetical protein